MSVEPGLPKTTPTKWTTVLQGLVASDMVKFLSALLLALLLISTHGFHFHSGQSFGALAHSTTEGKGGSLQSDDSLDEIDDFYASDTDMFDDDAVGDGKKEPASDEQKEKKKPTQKKKKKKRSKKKEGGKESDASKPKPARAQIPPFTIENYFYEFILLNVLGLYIIAFLIGRSTNANLARGWLTSSQQVFMKNFAQMGVYTARDGMDDQGNAVPVRKLLMLKECDHRYIFYATGRAGCWAITAAVELVRRQDLLHYLLSWVDWSTAKDTVTLRVEMDESAPACVFAIAKKKQMQNVRELDAGVNKLANPIGSQRLSDKYAMVSDTSETEREGISGSVFEAINNSKGLFQHAYYTDRFVEVDVNAETGERKLIGGAQEDAGVLLRVACSRKERARRAIGASLYDSYR